MKKFKLQHRKEKAPCFVFINCTIAAKSTEEIHALPDPFL